VVVANVQLYVGIPAQLERRAAGTVVDPEVAEARMLVLLNQARQQAGLAQLVTDTQLRDVAAGHTEDMADHHFFSHVSPSTGAPEDRAKRAGLLVSLFGENIALSATPETAHEGLMGSPGHRANMLRPEFTHVGIAADKSDSGLVVTMVFGRRPAATALPANAAQVEAAMLALRASKGVPAVGADPIYRVGAQAGADALADGSDASDVAKAIDTALQREIQRQRAGRPASCVLQVELLELSQLNEMPLLASPALRRFGLGARVRRDAKGTRLSTVFMLEGVPCR